MLVSRSELSLCLPMQGFFVPAISLMNRLAMPRKLLALALIFLVAVAAVGYWLIDSLNEVVAVSQTELAGLALIGPVTRTMQLLQQHRGLSGGLLSGDSSLREARAGKEVETLASFATLIEMMSAPLASSVEWRLILAEWDQLRRTGLASSPAQNFLAHVSLLERLQRLKTQIADEYALSFHPGMDAHYLIDTAIVDLPLALETLGQVRALGTAILATGRISEQQKGKMYELIADLHSAHKSLATNLQKSAPRNPEIHGRLAAAFADIDASLYSFLDRLQVSILAGRFDTQPAHFFESATLVIDKGYLHLYQTLLPTAESFINERIHVAQTDMLCSVGIALALLLIAYYLFAGIYLSTVHNIRSLAASAQGFAAGDLSRRVDLQTRDELSQVGDSFNHMADRFNSLLEARVEDGERLRAIVDAALDAVIQMDAGGRISGWSKHAETIFGWSRDEAVGRLLHETIIPQRYRDAHLRGLSHFLATGEGPVLSTRVEIEGLHRDGREFPIELAISSIKTARGVEFSAFLRDISQRKRAESALRVAAIAFETEEGITITDADEVILNVNESFTTITGYRAEEVIGKTPAILKSGRHDAQFYQALWKTLCRDRFWQGEIWNRRKNGEEYPQWLSITAVTNEAGQITNYIGSFSDITQRKQSEQTIHHLAFYDPLTDLPNRRLLLDRLQQALAASRRNKRCGAVLLIDLDNFKTLNETLGHDIGDLLLQQVARRLGECIRDGDTVARPGGDEFVVMLEDLSGNLGEAASQAETVGEKILLALNQNYRLDGHDHHSTPSIGVTLFSDRQGTTEELLKRADLAMYQAKAAGRNTLRFFDPQMQALVSSRAALEADLRQALQREQFVLHYQAQVDGEGVVRGVEALIRWQHSQRGLLSPLEFIPLAEETGLILPLGYWVVQSACAQLAAWAGAPQTARLSIAVNVSALQFHHRDFVDQVLAALEHTGADPRRLKLELTESLMVDDVDGIIAKMSALKEQGVAFSLDDFGTGYSSLSYLKRLPLDQLKIDQGFVRNILVDPNDAAIARMVIALAASLGLDVIAEGVETREQQDFLARSGCHAYQGYLFSLPLPVAEFLDYLQRA